MSSSLAGCRSSFCFCAQEAHLRTSWTVDNPGRRFFGCRFWKVDGGGCKYFNWLDDPIEERAKSVILSLLKEKSEFAMKRQKDTNSVSFVQICT
ncbi:hypothetical protein ACS0TY_014853 [Phlomoides rotata]